MTGLTATDLFAGAGGSTLGAEAAGVDVALAVNHWAPAVDTLTANHHRCVVEHADLRQISPARYFHTDLLLASPSCVGHSKARRANARPADPRNWRPDITGHRARATMWDVLEWMAIWSYDAVILENVVEWRSDPGFDAFTAALTRIGPHHGGYDHQLVYDNAMFHTGTDRTPVAQSRDRLFLVAWKHHLGRQPDLSFGPDATCDTCGPVTAEQHFRSDFTTKRHLALDAWVAGTRTKPNITWGMYGRHGQWTWNCPHCWRTVHPPVATAATIIDHAAPVPTFEHRTRRIPDKLRHRILDGLADNPNPAGDWIVLNFGSSQPGKTGGRIYRVDDQPVNAITAQDQKSLLRVPDGWTAGDGLGPLGYRRLTVNEIRSACAFPATYELAGTSTDQYRLLGNAVVPPVMRDLTSRVIAALDQPALAA